MKRKAVVALMAFSMVVGNTAMASESSVSKILGDGVDAWKGKESVKVDANVDVELSLAAEGMTMDMSVTGGATVEAKVAYTDDEVPQYYVKCLTDLDVVSFGETENTKNSYYILPEDGGYNIYEGTVNEDGEEEFYRSFESASDVEEMLVSFTSDEEISGVIDNVGFEVEETGEGYKISLNKNALDTFNSLGNEEIEETLEEGLTKDVLEAIMLNLVIEVGEDSLPQKVSLNLDGSDFSALSDIIGDGMDISVSKAEATVDLSYDGVGEITLPEGAKIVGADEGTEVGDDSQDISSWVDETLVAGTDIEPGEYIFTTNGDGDGYIEVYSGSEMKYANTYSGNVFFTLEDGDEVGIYASDYALVDENTKVDTLTGTMFRVGIDIKPGVVSLEQDDSDLDISAYWCLYSDSKGTVVDNGLFDGTEEVEVEDGQYLSLSRCKIAN